MDEVLKESLWNQFGASLDMLDNAIAMCPDEQWAREECWYLAFHTLFWTDLYVWGAVEGFAPPSPYTLGELDPAGVMPERMYTQDELRSYVQHCRERSYSAIEALDDARAAQRCSFGWGEASYFELFMYNMRHVQHGAAQLNLLMRQSIDSAPRWVAQARA